MQILVSLFGNLPLWRQALRGIGAVLCNLIYSLIGWLYHLFMVVARLNILSSEQIQPIYQRVTMILTIVMTFYITFEFVKYVMQPDNFLDKEKGVGNITFRIIVVILLIAFVPKIFTMAYDLQNKIIENQVISKIIIGKKDSNFADLGGSFSSNMLGLFYEVDEDVCHGGCNEEQVIVSKNLSNLATGDSFDISNGINSSESEDTPRIRFDGFMAILVGVFIGYILVMYCIDVGTRYAQIIFLQIMAPVAIMGYLAPKKDNMFQKWWKQCLTTYLDLFIRLAIIHFILLIVEVLGDAYNSNSLFEGIADLNDNVKNFTYIFLVMGLLAFAQKAPKMISELLPGGGAAGIGFGLGAKGRIEPTTKAVKGLGNAVGTGRRVAGGVGGFLAGGVAGRSLKAALSGAKTGFDKNTKGFLAGSAVARWRNAAAAGGAVRQKREDVKNEGGEHPFLGEHFSGHYKNVAQGQDRRVAKLDNMINKKKAVASAVENIKFRQQMETMGQAIEKTDAAAGKEWVVVKKKAEKLARQYAAGEISSYAFQHGVNGLINKFNSDMGGRVAAANINTGSFDTQLSAMSEHTSRIGDAGVTTEWKKVQTKSSELKAKLDNKEISNSDYETQVNQLIADFNNSAAVTTFNSKDENKDKKISFSSITGSSSDDFEIGSSKWGTVHTAIEEARIAAQDVKDEVYKDVDGKEHTIGYDEKTFAGSIGDYADNSETAISQIKADPEYKAAHAYAKGADNK